MLCISLTYNHSLFLRRHNHVHTFAFQTGHHLGFAVFEQRLGEFEQLRLALLLVDDGATAEEHLNLHLVALLQETDGMLQLEVEIMLVGLRTEADLLDHHLRRIGTTLFLLLLLLIEVLLVLDDLAHRRIGVGRNHHQVEAVGVSTLQGVAGVHDGGLHALTHYTHDRFRDAFIDKMGSLLFHRTSAATFEVPLGTIGIERCCYNLVLLF